MSDNWNEKLFEASKDGDLSALQEALNRGADINVLCDDENETALIKAACNGHTDCVQYLIDAGAAVDVVNSWGDTALVLAAEFDHKECVRVLISAGVDINSLEGEDKARYSSIIDVELKKRAEKEAREQQKVKLVMQEKKRKTFRKQMRSRGL